MKFLSLALGAGLLVLAALATPVSLVYGLHEWVIIDIEFKYALWEACKVWLSMLCLAIPGVCFLVLGGADL